MVSEVLASGATCGLFLQRSCKILRRTKIREQSLCDVINV